MANIETQEVTYEAVGTPLKGYLAKPSGDGPFPGVLVVHEWWGLNDYIRRRANQVAELGYCVLAIDMYGEGKTAETPDEAGALMTAVLSDRPAADARLKAGLEQLKAAGGVDPTRIGAMGYCFGGACALHAARIGLPLKGVVSFHGALGSMHKPEPGSVKAKVLVLHGEKDVLVSDEEQAAFKTEFDEAKVDYRFVVMKGGLHAFTNPAADENAKKYSLPLKYDKALDEQSWDEMKNFFAQTL